MKHIAFPKSKTDRKGDTGAWERSDDDWSGGGLTTAKSNEAIVSPTKRNGVVRPRRDGSLNDRTKGGRVGGQNANGVDQSGGCRQLRFVRWPGINKMWSHGRGLGLGLEKRRRSS